jgi:hypothetical protein
MMGLIRDLAGGFAQQMFFWGRDVVHPSGNLLAAQSCVKSPSTGLQGTSCYALAWQGGLIHLHGSCAGWFPQGGGEGFIYIRPLRGCFIWKGGELPVPGDWSPAAAAAEDPVRLHELAAPFLDWWEHSEAWVKERFGSDYRSSCFAHFKRLPGSRPWLPPAEALRWIGSFRHTPGRTDRVRRLL